MTNQSELERMLIKLCWVTAPSNQDDVDKVLAYITANYTPNSEVERRVRKAEIDGATNVLSILESEEGRLRQVANTVFYAAEYISELKGEEPVPLDDFGEYQPRLAELTKGEEK